MRRVFFILSILLFLFESFIHANGKNSHKIKFSAILYIDSFLNNGTDGKFGHYACDYSKRFKATLNESTFGLNGILGKLWGYDVDFGTSFDFMGDDTFEIVESWIRLTTSSHYLLIGKAENLVSTDETTLNYDGFYTAGGIQTGAHANQTQLQFGYTGIKDLTFAFSLTNEEAQNGSPDGDTFSIVYPCIEGAAIYNNSFLEAKIAFHYGTSENNREIHFHPTIIMTQENLKFNDSISLLLTGFTTQSGSQFFPVDVMYDYVNTADNNIEEQRSEGGLVEFIYKKSPLILWAGGGIFKNRHSFVETLREYHISNSMIQNIRFSSGIKISLPHNLSFGTEYSLFLTHFIEKSYHASSLQIQITLSF